jgi:hypothetical protein
MECPFCAEAVKEEAIVCGRCSRELRVARPVMLEVQALAFELDRLRRELEMVNAKLARMRFPVRYFVNNTIAYVVAPIMLLVAAHTVVTIILDVTPLYLRLASVVLPLPFGLALYVRQKVGLRGAVLVGFLTATLAVTCMLVVTGYNDDVPIVPGPWIEWREVIEYIASIALAFITGNILGSLILDVLPQTMAQDGKPNAIVLKMAGALGQHVGEEQLRRRARNIQNLLRTAGPVAGLVATAVGSVYAGLKGIFGW